MSKDVINTFCSSPIGFMMNDTFYTKRNIKKNISYIENLTLLPSQEMQSDKLIKEDRPCFSTLDNYELDFLLTGIDDMKYGIEVKTKKGTHNSLNIYLNKGKIDKAVYAKYTAGGSGSKVYKLYTIPIYTVASRFPYSDLG